LTRTAPARLLTAIMISAIAALAAGLAAAVPAGALPPPSHLHAGEFCSTSDESYYEQYGYTCRIASDGRYRLFTYSGGSSGGSHHHPSYTTGRTILFAARTRTNGCRLRDHGALPDRRCTPGAYFANATRVKICQPGWSKHVRDVSEATKQAVYLEYGIRSHHVGGYEIDHLVPLEDGGANSIATPGLSPEGPARGPHTLGDLRPDARSAVDSAKLRPRLAGALSRRILSGSSRRSWAS
jgi:hypothetical protein